MKPVPRAGAATWDGSAKLAAHTEPARASTAPKARINGKLLLHLRRWKKIDGRGKRRNGDPITHVVHYYGEPIQKLRRSWDAVAIEAGHGVWVPDPKHKDGGRWKNMDGPHICRHTAATWQMQSKTDPYEAAGFLGMTVDTLLEVYGHHHPDYQSDAAKADGRRR